MNKYIVLLFCGVLFNSEDVYGARLFFESNEAEFSVGEEFIVDLFLDTESETVNAVGGDIVFSPELLEIQEIRDGNSIVNFWLDKPAEPTSGLLTFSGITPGGYNNDRVFILSVVFKASGGGEGQISLGRAEVLKNDGLATPAEVKVSSFQFLVIDDDSQVSLEIESIDDKNPPEKFSPQISRDDALFDGEYFLVFAAQDKESGIDHYEVEEEGLSPFRTAESPYNLQNQKLDSKISIKAVDKSGNVRIVTIYPPGMSYWYNSPWIFAVLILAIILVIYLTRKGKHAKKN